MSQNVPDQAETIASKLDEYDKEILMSMYRKLRSIREFERTASRLSEAGELPGPVHLYLGQEAVAVGTALALGEDDIIGSTHRGHGHVLAKGADIDRMMAELAGKEPGLNHGRGGSMHMVDFSLGIFGCNAIVGASVPHVAGGVLSAKLDGEDRVGVAFFGEGASSEGVVHETMNIASVWDLPVVFLCENNGYAVSTADEDAIAGEHIADRAQGYDIPGKRINGQDVLSVYEEVGGAIETARSDQTPYLVECETLRYSGHFSGEETLDWLEDRPYRPDNEVEEWKADRDPVESMRTALIQADIQSENDLEGLDAEIESELEKAAEFAVKSDEPHANKAVENVYTNQDYQNIPAPKYR